MFKQGYSRIFFIFVVIVSFIAFSGYCKAIDETSKQLKLELKNEGVSDEFIKTVEPSVEKMIALNVKISDLKTVLLDLWNEGVKSRALKNAVAAVAELVKSGDNVLEAASIASGAAHKAQAEGLSGFGVGMRVKKAVNDRKAYLKSTKNP
ncbi:MAG: hypothetical protein PHU64_00030 [Candidatus Omnitrophica bacterium]|nr:hypothetical protein [Candidatus Omnitrophota bacterium]MDD5430445.1 hypothetical protein [Candidatus Omnitrophota bacterium]